MNNSPLVSIIIATFNRGNYIKKAIESVLRQSYQNIEIIIIDDGSTDDTKEIVNFYLENKKIKYIYQKNTGPAGARNKGIKNSKGKYIAILDSDDFWCDDRKLEKQVEFFEKHSEYVLTGGGAIVINEKNNEIVRYLLPKNDTEIKSFLLLNNPFVHSTVVFRKSVWEKSGGYNNQFDFYEDWDLWLKFGKIGKIYNFQEYFVYYLRSRQNRTYQHNVRRNLLFNIKFRKRYRNNYSGFIKAIFLCLASYFYSFMPFNQDSKPIFLKFRKLLFGSIPCKYYKNEKEI